MNLFRAVFLLLSFVVFFYCYHQLARFPEVHFYEQSILFLVLFIVIGSIVVTPLYFFRLGREQLTRSQKNFIKFSYNCMAYINFLLFSLMARDLIGFVLSFYNEGIHLYQRQATWMMLGIPFILSLWGYINVHSRLAIKTLELYFTNLPPSFDQYKIVQVSDIHVSEHLPRALITRLYTKILPLKPNIIVATGDIVDGPPQNHIEDLNELKKLGQIAPVYWVSGNHEYYWNYNEIAKALNAISFYDLNNKSVRIEKSSRDFIHLLGVPDPTAKVFKQEYKAIDKLADHLPLEDFKILLSHQPKKADLAKDLNIDLQLSGHTHRGQFFPWNFLIGFFQKYTHGHYDLGRLQLYVNQGSGYWGIPIRLGTVCEVTQIILRKKLI